MKSNKIISVLMSATLLCSSFITTVKATETTLCNETFDGMEVGSVPSESGNGFSGGEGSTIYAFPSANNKSIGTRGSIYNTFDKVDSGSIIISYDYYIESFGDDEVRLMQVWGDGKKTSGTRSIAVHARADNTLRTSSGILIGYYSQQQWFNVSVVADIDKDKYDIYLNGRLSAEDISFRENADSIGCVETYAAKGTIYADNAYVSGRYADKATATAALNNHFSGKVYREDSIEQYPIGGAGVVKYITRSKNASQIVTLANDTNASNKAIRLDSETLTNTLPELVDDGALLISYDVFMGAQLDTRMLHVYGNDTTAGDERTVYVGTRTNNSVGYFTINNNVRYDQPYKLNDWNNISVLCDLDNDKYYVYLNGKNVDANGFSFFGANGNAIQKIQTMYDNASPNGNSAIFLDNIYTESFSSAAVGRSVLDYRLNTIYGELPNNDASETYTTYGAGYLNACRSIPASVAERTAAENNLVTLVNDYNTLYAPIWHQDFDKFDSGYAVIENDGFSHTQNATVMTIGNRKALKLTNAGERARINYKPASGASSYMVSFDFMQETISNVSCIARSTDKNGEYNAITIYSESGNLRLKYRDDDGNVKDTVMCTYEAGEWYNISYYLDLETEKLVVLINGNPIANIAYYFHAPFASNNLDNVDRVFDSWTDAAGTYYLDNIEVYNNAPLQKMIGVSVPERSVKNLELTTPVAAGYSFAWTSANTNVIAADGTVTPAQDRNENVNMTLNAEYGDYKETRDYNVIVKCVNDMIADVQKVSNAIYIPATIADNEIVLPRTSNNNVSVVWSSNSNSVNVSSGTVTLPVVTDENVTLSASLTFTDYPAITQTKNFNVTLKAVDEYVIQDVIYSKTGGSTTRDFNNASGVSKILVKKFGNSDASLFTAGYDNGILKGTKMKDVTDGWNTIDWSIPTGSTHAGAFIWEMSDNVFRSLAKAYRTDLTDTNFWMLGDSIMATYDPNETSRVGWGSIIEEYFNDVTVHNENAKPGYGLKKAVSAWNLNNVLCNVKNGDYVFISYAHNDSKPENADAYLAPDTDGAYQQYLTRYAEAVRARGAQPIFVTSVERLQYNDNGTSKNTLKVYADSMKEVAEILNVPVIDLNTATNNALNTLQYSGASRYYMVSENDTTHLTSEGAAWVCDMVLDGIRALELPIQNLIKTN